MIGDGWSVAAITSHLCQSSEECFSQQLWVHSQLIVVCIYWIDRPQGDRKAFKCHAFFLPAFQSGHLSSGVCESEQGIWMPITREVFFLILSKLPVIQIKIWHFYKKSTNNLLLPLMGNIFFFPKNSTVHKKNKKSFHLKLLFDSR